MSVSTLSSAGRVKRILNPQVTYVGVTGSCGKTTTASLIGRVLRGGGECCVNVDANGVRSIARSIIAMPRSTRYSVHEVCGAKPGKVVTQTRVLRPQVGVITAVGGDHYKNYRTLAATAQEKGMLAEAVSRDGTVLLNADDPHVLGMRSRCRGKVVTYGLSADADVRGTNVSSVWPDRLSLTVTHDGRSIQVDTQLAGEHWATTVLAAFACGIVCGLDPKVCAKAIASFEPPFGRYSVHRTAEGADYVVDLKAVDWTIPASLKFLEEAKASRKTVVFGTLSDYAANAGKKYRRVARDALTVADRVVFVGAHASHVERRREGEDADRLHYFQTTHQAAEFIRSSVQPGELVLLKGTITIDHLERIMLSHGGDVVCWRQSCGRMQGCPVCSDYRKPSPPPFGLVKRVKPSLVPRPDGDRGRGIQLPPAS
jgi:UDP-N-acetylmuramoyl-tripeptide--D-alanyl-D-alanine ligase